VKCLFPAALSIEILCVASAEIGGLLGLYYFGFNLFGITMAYLVAYALAGFTTFASILGRSHGKQGMIILQTMRILILSCAVAAVQIMILGEVSYTVSSRHF
jgi:hypothetical protein